VACRESSLRVAFVIGREAICPTHPRESVERLTLITGSIAWELLPREHAHTADIRMSS